MYMIRLVYRSNIVFCIGVSAISRNYNAPEFANETHPLAFSFHLNMGGEAWEHASNRHVCWDGDLAA